jgi:ATP-dependent DNA helicase DinG
VTESNFISLETGLAQHLEGFKPRPSQEAMAQAVTQAIQDQSILVAEAGTGTGKTLAYLLPAAASERRVIVSTATKTLQDQIFNKDVPLIRRVLNRPIKTALLKGRANYLCLSRVESYLGVRPGHTAVDIREIEAIRRWSKVTSSGEISEATEVSENSAHWAQATSTKENCLGSECPQYSDCFLVKARNRAREADVVIVNHHLLWADWALRNDGFGELLPEADAIVIDEAHQFLEAASQFLGSSLTSRQLIDLSEDIALARFKEAPDVVELLDEAERLERLVFDLRIAMGDSVRKDAWDVLEGHENIHQALGSLKEQLLHLESLLSQYVIRGKATEACHKRTQEMLARFDQFLELAKADHIRWFETRKKGFSLNQTPLDVAEEFNRMRASRSVAWIFTSATLSVSGKFEHFMRQLGIEDATCRAWESPFDYPGHCRLYLPEQMPDPSDSQFNATFIQAILPVLECSQGRAFVLFTSHSALAYAAQMLPRWTSYPLFVQGAQPKSHLLDAFRQSGNGVLLGTATFWEGVDVPGDALSCVIIDRLPFAAPNDPVLEARLNHLKKQGMNPFMHYQVPAAIIALKQGIGRLIRDDEDRGLLAIMDPRLYTKPYGKRFLAALPVMPIVRNLDGMKEFFSKNTV